MGYLAILIYLGANYHILNIFTRNALGEILAMTFIPLVLYAIYRILVKHEECFIFLGVSFSLLVMSHLITSYLYGLFFFLMIIIFVILNKKDKVLIVKTIKTIIKGTILALLLTAWYLLPMFEQLHTQMFMLNMNAKVRDINDTVLTFKSIFDINSYKNTGLCILILSTSYIFVKNNKYINIINGFCLFLYLILLGIINGKFLNTIQFYFRLYILIFPLLTITSVYTLNIISNKKFKYVLSVMIVLLFVFNVLNINLYSIRYDEYKLDNNATIDEINTINSNMYIGLIYNHDELGGAEYLPYSDYMDYTKYKRNIKYLDEQGALIDYISEYDKTFTTLIFACDNKEDKRLILPISYYKGYSAYELIDNKWEKVDLSFSEIYKLLLLESPKGTHTYKIYYRGTMVQYLSLTISSLSFIILIINCLKRKT